jgi:hypothetical protein
MECLLQQITNHHQQRQTKPNPPNESKKFHISFIGSNEVLKKSVPWQIVELRFGADFLRLVP